MRDKKYIQNNYISEISSGTYVSDCSNPRRTLKGAATLRTSVKLRSFCKRGSFLLPEYFVVVKCTLPHLIRK